MSITLYKNNDNIVDLEGLKMEDDNYINNADVTLKIFDSQGAEKMNKLMQYVTNSNGNYRVVVPYDLDVESRTYRGELTVDHNSRRGFWEGTIEFRTRRLNF